MIIRTLAASAAVLILATGGAFAQAAAPAAPAMPGSVTEDPSCATLNGMAAADQTKFAQDYLDAMKGSDGGGVAAVRNSNDAMAGAGANQAGEPGEASGGPEDNMAAAPANGQPAAAGAQDNRNEELDQAANAADDDEQALPPGDAKDQQAAANAAPAAGANAGANNNMAANNAAAPAGVSEDDAVNAFEGLDAAGLITGCKDKPDSTFSQIIAPAP